MVGPIHNSPLHDNVAVHPHELVHSDFLRGASNRILVRGNNREEVQETK